MTSEAIKVLLVEDNPGDVRLIREMLKESKTPLAALEDTPSLTTAVERLAKEGIDAVLLDLGLPDSQGISTFVKLHNQFPRTPIVVLTGLTDEELGLQAVREGAQDYLIKGKVDSQWLCRAILYAVERVQGKEALERSEEQYRLLFEKNLAGVYRTALDRRITDCNEAFVKVFGYASREEILAHPVQDLYFDPREPEAIVARIRTERTLSNLEMRLKRKDGSPVWVLVNENLIEGEAGRQPFILGTIIDITLRKEAEEALRQSESHLRAIVETEPECVVKVASNGDLLQMNPAGLAMIEAESFAEVRGKSVLPLIIPEHTPAFKAFLRGVCSGNRTNLEFEIVGFKGTRRWVESYAAPIADETGASCMLAVMRDLTERKQGEKALRGLSTRLLQLQDEERRRVARELHDAIGQNLVGLVTNLTLAQRSAGKLNPKARKALSGSLEVAERSLNEMRTLSYLLHPPLLDEDGLASALAWYVKGFAERSGIKVDLKVSPDFGRLPQEAETTLFRVVQESLTNVHRHSKSPTAMIRLSRRSTGVELEIRDKGQGMSAKTIHLGNSHAGQLGVGIMGMRERARQLGGRLEIASSRRGTTVRVVIPHSEVVP
ncbi:MAG: PAS domain S-box protein [Acidobacteriia bacterium]|nr:PAS domain S-box protein [Terriglobia bacterium]